LTEINHTWCKIYEANRAPVVSTVQFSHVAGSGGIVPQILIRVSKYRLVFSSTPQ
jgi:hypothetical protein